MVKHPSTQLDILPSKADNTQCPIESPADVFAKTDTIYPTIYHELKEKPFKWVKNTNGTIIIVNPSSKYRRIQNTIRKHLIQFDKPSRYSLFGVRGGFHNLTTLRGFFDILVVDVRNAYDSITYTRICGLLRSRGLEPANKWAKYCVFNGSLMRGSTCSNQILESVLIRLDYRLAGLSHRLNLKMRRYSDEYWFYGDFQGKNLRTFLYDVNKAIKAEGFHLNKNKTYVERQIDFAIGEGHWQ